MPILSVIVPVFNEEKTIREILDKINAVNFSKEIIVIDNCSTDNTQEILKVYLLEEQAANIRIIYHSVNKGKGTSIREGIDEASGDFIVIQDADLEYDPNEYINLLQPAKEKKADLVLGARFTKGSSGLLAHRIGNKLLTKFLNIMFGSRLNDYATCYKLAPKHIFKLLRLESPSFEIEVEIVCKALRKGLKITEVPISYYPRTYKEGKKIRWSDGMKAILSIIKYRFIN